MKSGPKVPWTDAEDQVIQDIIDDLALEHNGQLYMPTTKEIWDAFTAAMPDTERSKDAVRNIIATRYSIDGQKLSGFGRDRVPISSHPVAHDDRRRKMSPAQRREYNETHNSKPGVREQLAAKAHDYRTNPATRPTYLATQANNDLRRDRPHTNMLWNQRYHNKKDREADQSAEAAYASGPKVKNEDSDTDDGSAVGGDDAEGAHIFTSSFKIEGKAGDAYAPGSSKIKMEVKGHRVGGGYAAGSSKIKMEDKGHRVGDGYAAGAKKIKMEDEDDDGANRHV